MTVTIAKDFPIASFLAFFRDSCSTVGMGRLRFSRTNKGSRKAAKTVSAASPVSKTPETVTNEPQPNPSTVDARYTGTDVDASCYTFSLQRPHMASSGA